MCTYLFRSTKLKPFWLSITEKESQGVPLLDWLSNSLLSQRYSEALSAALKIPQCPIIPFFGSFIKELTDVVINTPSLVVLAPNLQGKELQKLQEVSRGARSFFFFFFFFFQLNSQKKNRFYSILIRCVYKWRGKYFAI